LGGFVLLVCELPAKLFDVLLGRSDEFVLGYRSIKIW